MFRKFLILGWDGGRRTVRHLHKLMQVITIRNKAVLGNVRSKSTMSLLCNGSEVNSLLHGSLVGQAPSTAAERREPVRGQLPVSPCGQRDSESESDGPRSASRPHISLCSTCGQLALTCVSTKHKSGIYGHRNSDFLYHYRDFR